MIPKQHLAFTRGALGRGVCGSVVAGESFGHRRRAAIDGVEDLVDKIDLG